MIAGLPDRKVRKASTTWNNSSYDRPKNTLPLWDSRRKRQRPEERGRKSPSNDSKLMERSHPLLVLIGALVCIKGLPEHSKKIKAIKEALSRRITSLTPA